MGWGGEREGSPIAGGLTAEAATSVFIAGSTGRGH